VSFAFDTLAYARKLRDAKIPQEQAEAMADALASATTAVSGIESSIAVIKAELTFHRWVFLAMIGLQVTILIKLFLK
jgi:FtsH-binding integral membrane protein